MKKIFVFLTLSLVVLSSGCTIPFLNIKIPFLPELFPGMQIQEQKHDVIAIESLQAIPSTTLRSDQSVRLRAIVKNLQKPEYAPIENVVIGLFNDCGMFNVNVEFCQGDKSNKDGMHQCSLSRMYPQSTAIVEWTLSAKTVNVETPCKVGVLAQYDYKTYSTGSVTFVNKIELERLVSEGKSFSETGVAVIGEGPIKPYIEVLSQPIVIDPTLPPQSAGTGIMSFWIENKGSGILDISESTTENIEFECDDFNPRELTGGVKKMCVEVESADDKIMVKKEGETAPIKIEKCIQEHMERKREEKSTHSINFIDRSTPKYSCSIIVSNPPEIRQEKTYQITAMTGYSYKFTKEITITVQPTIRL